MTLNELRKLARRKLGPYGMICIFRSGKNGYIGNAYVQGASLSLVTVNCRKENVARLMLAGALNTLPDWKEKS